jgi:hypothetical protein
MPPKPLAMGDCLPPLFGEGWRKKELSWPFALRWTTKIRSRHTPSREIIQALDLN